MEIIMHRKILNIRNGGAALVSGLMLCAALTGCAATTTSSPGPLMGSSTPPATLTTTSSSTVSSSSPVLSIPTTTLSTGPAESAKPTQPAVAQISVQELKKRFDNKQSFILIDVRPEKDYTKRHIPTAICIPVDNLTARISDIPHGPEMIVYSDCA
jgi:hypothetical protein